MSRLSTEVGGKNEETCQLDLNWINKQATLLFTFIILTTGIAGVHSKSSRGVEHGELLLPAPNFLFSWDCRITEL